MESSIAGFLEKQLACELLYGMGYRPTCYPENRLGTVLDAKAGG